MRIVELREAKGWSQAELAARTGLRIATLSQLENNKGNPKLGTLSMIASALDVSVLDLFTDEGSDPEIAEIVSRLRRAPAEERAAILTLLRQRR